MAIKRRVVVGVFDSPALANNAVNALRDAGFGLQQILIASHYSETEERRAGGPPAAEHRKPLAMSLLEGLKQLFTGKDVSETDVASTDVEGDLTGMGLSCDAARYYEDQYKAGKSVIGVRAEDREDDALAILREHGGHDFDGRAITISGGATRFTGGYGRPGATDQPAQAGMMPPPPTDTTGIPEMQPRMPVTGPRATQEPNATSGSRRTAGSFSHSDIERTGTANPMRSRNVNEPQPATDVETERERMRMEEEGGPAHEEPLERERATQADVDTEETQEEQEERETREERMPSEQEARRAREQLENEYERRIREQPSRGLEEESDIETDL